MSPLGLVPTDVSINTAIAICAIAFVSGTARGFSGFGSARPDRRGDHRPARAG
jgi:hypothetical protein